MEKHNKKNIILGVICACLVFAGIITFATRLDSSGGINALKGMTWAKCSDENCGHEYQIDLKEYYQYVQENRVSPIAVPPLLCPKCQELAVYKAVKCNNCGLVFFEGIISGDFDDRCPECDYSKLEEKRREALN
jgi:hypothetical protein